MAFKQDHWPPDWFRSPTPHFLCFAVVACRESHNTAADSESAYGALWSTITLLHFFIKQHRTSSTPKLNCTSVSAAKVSFRSCTTFRSIFKPFAVRRHSVVALNSLRSQCLRS